MTAQEIAKEFIRVTYRRNSIEFRVKDIFRDGPAHPYSTWELSSRIDGPISEKQITDEIERILHNKRHFRTCEECGDLNPIGWMNDERICQSCAERNHGVVH